MLKINKKIYIASIFTLIGVVLWQEIAYSLPDSSHLRPPLATSKTAGELRDFQQQENLNPKIEIKKILNIRMVNITIFEVMVDGEEYEISGIGIKRKDPDYLTSKVVDNPEKCIEIAEAVNKVEGRLGEAAQREKWAWWSPKFASGQTVKGRGDKPTNVPSSGKKAKEKFEDYLRTEKPEEFYLEDILKKYRYLTKKDAVEILIKLKYKIGEYMEVTDSQGNPTSKLKQKALIHKDGDWHRTVHIIIVNKEGQLLRAIRGPKAHTSKGLFDVSSAGHVAIGSWKGTAIEEIREELAIDETELSELIVVGKENGFIKIGSPEEKEFFDKNGVYHYRTNGFNREFCTLCIAVTDLDADEINKRLEKQGKLRAVKSVDFVTVEGESQMAKLNPDNYSSTFRQYFLNKENTAAILKARDNLLKYL